MIIEGAVAAAVGVLAGLAAHRLVVPRRDLPRWLMILVGVGAAAIGTTAARAVREDPLGPLLTICAPLFFAVIALAVMAERLSRRADKDADGRSRH